jgi:hypothetical protein
MPHNPDGPVLSHWYELFEDFSTSTQDFYKSLEEAIRRRKIPEVEISRVLFTEGGLWTAKREYLRIKRGRIVCDICSAPYGTSHFFSWWVAKAPTRYGLLSVTALTMFLCYLFWRLVMASLLRAPEDSFMSLVAPFVGPALLPITFLFGIPIALFLLGMAVQGGFIGDEEWVLSTPVIGPLYNKIFKPLTYYRQDSAHMFRDSMQAIVGEVVNSLREERGLRLLVGDELEPQSPEEELAS